MYRPASLPVKKMYGSPLIYPLVNGYNEIMVKRYPFKINHFSCSSHTIPPRLSIWSKQGKLHCGLSAKDAEA
jgi:hypothetical protein